MRDTSNNISDHFDDLRAQLEQERARNAALEKERDEAKAQCERGLCAGAALFATVGAEKADGLRGEVLRLTRLREETQPAANDLQILLSQEQHRSDVFLREATNLRATLAALQRRCAKLETALHDPDASFEKAWGSRSMDMPKQTSSFQVSKDHARAIWRAAFRAALATDSDSAAAEGGAKP